MKIVKIKNKYSKMTKEEVKQIWADMIEEDRKKLEEEKKKIADGSWIKK